MAKLNRYTVTIYFTVGSGKERIERIWYADNKLSAINHMLFSNSNNLDGFLLISAEKIK